MGDFARKRAENGIPGDEFEAQVPEGTRTLPNGEKESWESIRLAAAAVGVTARTVSNWVRMLRAVDGSRWEFAADTEQPADEEWREITVEGEHFEVSSAGRVRCNDGHIVVGIKKGKHYRHQKHAVHRLVAHAFCEKQEGSGVVNHKNGNPFDNRAANLEWTSQRNNAIHAHALGLCRRRPVRRTCPDGAVIEYPTIKSASEASGVSCSDISSACRGAKKKAGGSTWEYAKQRESFEDPEGAPPANGNSSEPA